MKINDVPQSILSLLLSASGGEDEWSMPEALLKPLLPVMKFDPDKLLQTSHIGCSVRSILLP